MAKMTPLKITLYDPETQEIKAEHTQVFIPWKLLKQAVRLSKTLNAEDLAEEDVDSIAALVVETFGNRFTVDELSGGADVREMMTVLYAIINQAQGGGGSPGNGNFQQ